MTLSLEQQHALDELFARVPTAVGTPTAPDFLKTWFNMSGEELKAKLESLLARKNGFEEKVLTWSKRRPLDSVFEFLAAASFTFYVAEKDANPKINSYIDAFYTIATCASVGSADIFAVTQTGRAIAGLVMIVGPALAARVLDQPQRTYQRKD